MNANEQPESRVRSTQDRAWAASLWFTSLLVTNAVNTYFTHQFSTTAPHLTYTIDEPAQFEGYRNKFCIAYVSVANDGNKAAKDVDVSVRLVGARYKEVRVTPDHIKTEPGPPSAPAPPAPSEPAPLDPPFATHVDHLNPGESIRISMLTDEDTTALDRSSVKVLVRSDGEVGEEKSSDAENGPYRRSGFLIWLVVALVVLTGGFWIGLYYRGETVHRRRHAEEAVASR